MKKPLRVNRYQSPKAGEWIQPVRRGFRLACCDCGLVHTLNFRIRGGHVQFQAYPNTKATYGMRKRWNIKVTTT